MQYLEYVMELLEPIGDATSRSMFGGYGIFEAGDMFALITKDERLHFKVDDSNRADYETAESEKYGRMPYYEVPLEVFEDSAALRAWATASISIAHAAAKKKKR